MIDKNAGDSNPQRDLAWKFIEQTGVNIFLTGKAGTGKTTFLKNLRESSPKRMIVVAPTGVAAINAGGVTIHSFFQLPFGPYLPAIKREGSFKMQFGKEKRNIIKSLDLLVIDEISMVRGDLLDAIDDVLRRYKDREKPFGGVQLLMIGDLQQLAPVVKQDEWDLISGNYNSPYFFDSNALKQTDYITIELNHIYRQNDTDFIEILNKVRENSIDAEVINRLNSRYIKEFCPEDKEGYITLTSHNYTAKNINDAKLDAIASPSYTFNSMVEGEFPEFMYPTESDLVLKEGAQVMFIKNDISGAQRYYNGKIGIVTYVDAERIEVHPHGASSPIDVEIAEWTNAKYVIDDTTKEITEQIDGVFKQFPLKTAWAITIHKSQGLTFERAIIDAASSFSHGQVYVALSRCRSFEGLVLRSQISPSAIINDYKVSAFSKNAEQNRPDKQVLDTYTKVYIHSLIIDFFNFSPLYARLRWVQKILNDSLGALYPKLVEQWNTMIPQFDEHILQVGAKFQKQVSKIMSEEDFQNLLNERIIKGQEYFLNQFNSLLVQIVDKCNVQVDNKEVKKSLTDAYTKLMEVYNVKLALLNMDLSDGFVIHNYLDIRAKSAIAKLKTKLNRKDKQAELISKSEVGSQSEDIANYELFEAIRVWRKEKAEENNYPVYVILRQKSLIDICNNPPQNINDLLAVKGVGKSFANKYGNELLELIKIKS